MAQRFVLVVVALVLAACAPAGPGLGNDPGATESPVSPAATPAAATPSPTVAPTATPTQAPTVAPATATATRRAATPPGLLPATLVPGQPVTITALQMLDSSTGWAVGGEADARDRLLITGDGGQTWEDVTPPQPPQPPEAPAPIEAAAYFPSAEQAWAVFGSAGLAPAATVTVWHTEDRGQTWTFSAPLDLSALGAADFFLPSDLHFIDGETGWFIAHLGAGMNHDYFTIYRSTDGGATWRHLIDPVTEGPQSCTKTGLKFVDAETGWLTGDCYGVAPGLFFYRSEDGGETWQEQALPPPAGAPDLFTQSDVGCGTYSLTFFTPQSGKLAVACLFLASDPLETRVYLYSTSDGGQTWTSAPAPAHELAWLDEQVGWAANLDGGYGSPPYPVAHTTDGGQTWQVLQTVDWYGRLDFVDAQTGWAVAHEAAAIQLLHTQDGGQSWQPLQPQLAP